MEKSFSCKNINLSPALTWNWLKMNRSSLELTTGDLGGTFTLSGFEKNPSLRYVEDGSEIFASLPEMKNGCGQEADSIIDSFSPCPLAILAEKSSEKGEPVCIHFNLEDKKSHISRQVIVAEAGADLTVIMDYGTENPDAQGFHALQTKLWAKENARIHLIKVNLLGSKFTNLDDTAFYCEDGACVEVTQIELGAARTYAGVGTTLAGYQSKFKSNTAYFCRGKQFLDMNYAVWHEGCKTDTQMQVKGVLADDSLKVYRGTIDFKKGACGATGDEQEETLLLSPTAVNKSIPVILCGEDDVSGTHGATLGRLGSDELFYMQSRGISEEEAEKMMTKAKIMSVASLIPLESLRTKIENCLEK